MMMFRMTNLRRALFRVPFLQFSLMNGGTGVSLSCYYSKTILFVPVFLMVKLMIAASYNSFFS